MTRLIFIYFFILIFICRPVLQKCPCKDDTSVLDFFTVFIFICRPFLLECPCKDVRLTFAHILVCLMRSYLTEHGGVPVRPLVLVYQGVQQRRMF